MDHPPELGEEAIFEAARRLSGGDRIAYLETVCGADVTLRERVSELLKADESSGFLEFPALLTEASGSEVRSIGPLGEKVGDQIGVYRLVKTIDSGGFGVVWLAEQSAPVRRQVALKIIRIGMDTEEVIARFEQERQALAMMDHPHIAKVFDAGETDWGRPYFVMELVHGVPITTFCDEQRLTVPQRISLFIAVCHALQHAHQKGIVHRDLKPNNILVAMDDDGLPAPKVIDFGIAKAINQTLIERPLITRREQMIGTPAYMSPEQTMAGKTDIDTRSDIYSLGVVLYEVLTGQLPFSAEELKRLTYDELRQVIQEKEPLRPSTQLTTVLPEEMQALADRRETMPAHLPSLIQGDLDWIVMKAMEKDRARRYDTANGLANDLQRHLRNEPVLARPPSAPYLLQRFVRRHRFAVGASSAVLLALLGGIIASTREARRARKAEVLVEKQLGEVGVQSEAKVKALQELQEQMRRMSQSDQAVGDAYMEGDDYHSGVAMLQRAIRNDPENLTPQTVLLNTLVYGAGERDPRPRLLLPHLSGVQSARLSPDGLQVLTLSAGDGIQLWDATNGQPIGKPLPVAGAVLHTEFDPLGTRLLTATRAGVGFWNPATGQPASSSITADAPVLAARLSPDGRQLVMVTEISCRLWEVQDGRLLSQFPNSYRVREAAVSPDGTQLLLLAGESEVRLRSVATGEETMVSAAGLAPIISASFSRDGSRLLLVRKESLEVRKTLSPAEVALTVHSRGSIQSACFSPDGTRVLAIEENAGRIWDLTTGNWRGEDMLHRAHIRSAVFSGDGLRIVTAGDDKAARVWDAATSKPIGGMFRHEAEVLSAEFSSDGGRIVTAGADDTVRVWETAQPYAAGMPLVHWKDVRVADFSADGSRILTASVDGSARLWDARTGAPLAPFWLHNNPVVDGSFSPDGSSVVTASRDGIARLWDIAAVGKESLGLRHGAPLRSARFSGDGRLVLTAGEDGIALVWSAATGAREGAAVRSPGKLTHADFSPDGQRIVTTSDDGTARLWSLKSRQEICPPLRHAAAVLTAAFSRNGNRVATASEDRTARVWDATSGAPVTPPLRHIGKVRHVAFSPRGNLVGTASDDGTARVWDATSGQPTGTPMRHRADISVIRFSPDGTKVATGSGDNTARVWDATTGAPVSAILVHESDVLDVHFSPDGSWLVTGGGDFTGRIWDIATGQKIAPKLAQEAVAAGEGIDLSAHGVWEPVPGLQRLLAGEALAKTTVPDLATQATLRWLLKPVSERPLSPRSAVTPRMLADQILEHGNRAQIRSLVRYDPTHPLLPIAMARIESSAERAAFLRTYALDGLPASPVLWTRAAKLLLPCSPRRFSARAIDRLSELDPVAAAPLRAQWETRPPDPPATVAELKRFKLRFPPPGSEAIQLTREGEQWVTSGGDHFLWSGTTMVMGREGAVFVHVQKPDVQLFISNPTVPDARSYLQVTGTGWIEHATIEDPE